MSESAELSGRTRSFLEDGGAPTGGVGIPGQPASEQQKPGLTEAEKWESANKGQEFRFDVISKIKEKLEKLDSLSNPEQISLKELELENDRVELLNSVFKTQRRIVDKNLNHENTYPYNSGGGEYYLSNISDEFSDLSSKEWKREETKSFIKLLQIDAKWSKALYENQEGIAHIVPYYYSGADKIAAGLYEKPRKNILMPNVHIQYSADPETAKDLLLSAEDKKNLSIKIKGVEGEYPIESIRETAISYQDSFRFWCKAVAAESQRRVEKADNEQKLMGGNPLMRKNLAPAIIKELFKIIPEGARREVRVYYKPTGEKVKEYDTHNNVVEVDKLDFFVEDVNKLKLSINDVDVEGKPKEPDVPDGFDKDVYLPKELLNFFTMEDTTSNFIRYKSIMKALMMTDAYFRLKGCAGNDSQDNAEIQKIIEDVKGVAKDYESNWISENKSIKEKLAEVVINSEISLIQGSGAVAPLSPRWEYAERLDEDGKSIGHDRFLGMGPLNTQGDDWSPYYWFYHDMYYDYIGRKRSSMFPPTIGSFREQFLTQLPDSRTPISLEEARKIDPHIDYAFKMLLAETDEAKKWQKDNKIEINNTLKDILKQQVWFFMTPYLVKENFSNAPNVNFLNLYKKPTHETDENNDIYKFALIPMFIPTTFNSVNLFEVIRPNLENVELDAVSKNQTAWNQECSGTDPSQIRYLNVRDQVDDWNYVNKHMASRWLNLLTEVFTSDRDDNFIKFFSNEGGLKELIKRVGLGIRGERITYIDSDDKEKQIPRDFIELMIVPQMVVMALNMKDGFITETYSNATSKTSTKKDLSKWIKMGRYLPGKKGVAKYRSSMALMTWFYGYLYDRIGKDYGAQEHYDELDAETKIIDNTFGKK